MLECSNAQTKKKNKKILTTFVFVFVFVFCFCCFVVAQMQMQTQTHDDAVPRDGIQRPPSAFLDCPEPARGGHASTCPPVANGSHLHRAQESSSDLPRRTCVSIHTNSSSTTHCVSSLLSMCACVCVCVCFSLREYAY